MGLRNPKLGTTSRIVAHCLKELFPKSTWTYVEKLLCPGEQRERFVKHRLACTRRFSDDDIAALLQSDYGLQVLTAIMGDTQPRWWRQLRAFATNIDAMKAQRIAEKKLREAMNAGEELRQIEQRASALLVQDEDFMRPHVDALGAMGGAAHRAMAAVKRK